jgi:hypothetical protein
MKYYLGRIEETNGDMEYGSRFVFHTKGSPNKYMQKIAMEWRGSSKGDWDKELQGFWSDCTLIRDDGWREIPKEDFDVLSKYLAVL